MNHPAKAVECTGAGVAQRLEKAVAGLLEGLLTIVFMVIFVLVVVLVVLRYVFNTTIVGGNEAMVMLFTGLSHTQMS